MRLGLIKFLAGIPHIDATKALAHTAIFSAEENIRNAAIDAIAARPHRDYAAIFLKGLRYPWPAVAKRSAEAIARIGVRDLAPELILVLGENDPRMPEVKMVDGKQITVVRELVKLNHHRNCMMCHAPASVNGLPLVALVPVPGERLPQDYYQSSPEREIRFDVTYLRQDFSLLLLVENADPWPKLQHYDFLVRERKLTVEEAKEYTAKLTPKEGDASPYHQAAQVALRELSR